MKQGGDVKFLIINLIMGSVAFAGHYENSEVTDCRVNRMVDYTYFEEGLSAYEYPDVDVRISPLGQYTVSIGGHQAYELAEGDKITVKAEKPVKTRVNIMKKEGDEIVLEIEWRRTMAKLVIRVKEQGQMRFKTIAYGMCNKGILN
jgi:hypothetical protein